MPQGPKKAPSRGHMFKICLYREKHEKKFLSETTMPRALILGMKHHLLNLYQVCSNYISGAHSRGHMFYIGLYRIKHEKIFLSETIRLRALIFGMQHHLVDFFQVCSNNALGTKNGLPRVSPGTWSAFNRFLYVNFNKTQVSNLGALGPLVMSTSLLFKLLIVRTITSSPDYFKFTRFYCMYIIV